MRFVFPSVVTGTLFLGLASCGQPASSSSPVSPAVIASPSKPANAHQVGQFTATYDRAAHNMVFTPVAYGDGVTPDSWNTVGSTLGADGGPPTNTVNLITASGSCEDPWTGTGGGAGTFGCPVQLISGFSRSLTNVYAEITNATLDGGTTTAYDSISSSPALTTTNNGTQGPAHGFWVYNNSSENSGALWPVIGGSGSGFNSATVDWIFDNPSDQNVVYSIAVYATEFWEDYGIAGTNGDNTYGNMGYTDACAAAGSNAGTFSSGTKATITLPFDFTLYGTNSTSMTICAQLGEIGSGVGCEATLVNPSLLPKPSVNHPAFFPFWDKMKFGLAVNDQAPADSIKTAGRVCYETVPGTTAPNRIFVIEWRNMDFTAAPDTGSSLDFETYLYEGTGEIDVYYYNMAAGDGGVSGRESGSQAWVGLQGTNDLSVLTAEGSYPAAGSLGTGAAYSFQPLP